jgi:hypothetical protein
MLPNGDVNGCGTCHVTPGGPRNSFGRAVEPRVASNRRAVFWDAALAALDSDGDGESNGEELLDPNGDWEQGDANPGSLPDVTNPGVPDQPVEEDCDVEGDEDENGLADCDDPACEDLPECAEEDCDVEGDEDGNGLADCEDPACEDLPECDSGPEFVRGDANPNGVVDLSDAVFIFNFLFLGGPAPPCLKSADTNDDGSMDLSDGVSLLSHLFLGGPDPLGPFPACGDDPTDDELTCFRYPPCED